MGLYDTYVSPADDEGVVVAVQVKFTQLEDGLPVYHVGDKTPYPIYEGVIIGYEGYVVINAGIVQQVGMTIYDKWGGLLEPSEIINSSNPIAQVLEMTDLEQISSEELLEQIEEEEDDRAHLNSTNRELKELLDGVTPENVHKIIDLEKEIHEDFKVELPPVMLTNLEFNSLIALARAVLRDEVHETDVAIANLPQKVLELINPVNDLELPPGSVIET